MPSANAIIDDVVTGVWRLFGKEPDLARADLDVLEEIDHLRPQFAEARPALDRPRDARSR